VTGELLPRHIEIFSNNDFFRGVTIPKPQYTVGRFFSVIFVFSGTFQKQLMCRYSVTNILSVLVILNYLNFKLCKNTVKIVL